MRNADAEANVVPPPMPPLRQGSDSLTHFEGHQDRLERGVLDWHRIVEDHHHAVTGIARFLPPQVADLIVASGSEKQLESHRREITELFCDLRGFTGLTE